MFHLVLKIMAFYYLSTPTNESFSVSEEIHGLLVLTILMLLKKD